MPMQEKGTSGGTLSLWGNPKVRVALALFLLLVGLAFAFWIHTRDREWKRNHDAALQHGEWALDAGNVEIAKAYFEQAAKFNPYSADAHFALAEIYDNALGNNEDALKHYIAGLRCDAEHPRAAAAEKAMAALNMIRDGVIEDPLNVAMEMLNATNEKSFQAFKIRLGPEPAKFAEFYWEGWRRRGYGQLIQRRVVQAADGEFDSILAFHYADGVSMSMHFACRPGEPWLLTVAFP
jgi:Tfp pilus assembly protein PilF